MDERGHSRVIAADDGADAAAGGHGAPLDHLESHIGCGKAVSQLVSEHT
jgi:hypothetical protein